MGLPFDERYADAQQTLQTALDSKQSAMWTACPGIIQSYNAAAVTVVVQPSIQALYTGANLQKQWTHLPQCLDVPVCFPRGGNYTMTFPISAGDECLIVFSSRCIDNWWAKGGVQPQFEIRMHDLSDGFAIVGPFSQATKISNISTTTVQLRTNDGTIFVEIDAPNKVTRLVNNGLNVVLDANANTAVVTATTVNINATTTNISKDLNVGGNLIVTGGVTGGSGGADSVTVQHHTHNHGPAPDPGT